MVTVIPTSPKKMLIWFFTETGTTMSQTAIVWTTFLLAMLCSHVCSYEIVVCENEPSVIKCGQGETIMVRAAMFGRTSISACKNLGNAHDTNCKSNVKDFVVQKCVGRETCDLKVDTVTFQDPCVGTSKYLHVAFECKARRKICEGSKMDIECKFGGRISINNAIYGRLESDVCDSGGNSVSNVNCYSKYTNRRVRSLCNGKKKCQVSVSNSMFGEPCMGTSKYLDLFYTCV